MNNNTQTLTEKGKRELRLEQKEAEAKKRAYLKLVKKLTIWLTVFLGAAAVIFGLVKLVTTQGPTQNIPQITQIASTDRVKGSPNPKAVLIEYSDFQCPACGYYYPLLKQLTTQFSNDLQFVYRHFPLASHNHAKTTAAAAEAAGIQGKFWEMHDAIFENQNVWSAKQNAEEVFIEYAKNLGLDVEKFKKDLDSAEVKDKVEADLQNGRKAGVTGTPTFFLNGEKIQNPRSYAEFAEVVKKEISKNL